jgi:hypothetical protein
MSDQEINHFIATQINGWIHDEGIFYHDANGSTCYLADYCNSIAHAIDLALVHGVALKPMNDRWTAYKMSDETVASSDLIASKAICLCLTSTPTKTV